jgi:drug/metabolite transporter (DMT)-like permease
MLTLCNLFWAGNYIVGKMLVGLISPIWITFLRWLFASIILIFISKKIDNPSFDTIKKNLIPLTMMGILGILGYNLILYTALNYTSPLNASLINSLNPGILVLFSFFLLKEKISIQKIIGILVSLSGVLIVITKNNILVLKSLTFNFGDILMIIAIIVWSLYTIISKKLVDIKPITATAYSGLIAVIILIPMVIFIGKPPEVINLKLILSMLYIILFPSIGSFLFWNFSIKNIEASKAGIFLNLLPVFIAIISWFLGEKISSYQLIGGMLVFIGVLIMSNLFKFKNYPSKK